MNEIIQMKSQLSEVMLSLKQKDEIIKNQNLKMSQIANGSNLSGVSHFNNVAQSRVDINSFQKNINYNPTTNSSSNSQNFLGQISPFLKYNLS